MRTTAVGNTFQSPVSGPKGYDKQQYLERLNNVCAHWRDVLAMLETNELLRGESQEGPGWDRDEIQKYFDRSKKEYEVAEQNINREF